MYAFIYPFYNYDYFKISYVKYDMDRDKDL